MKKGNPDKGPRMIEGEQKFDKGYVSDNENIGPGYLMGDHMRGNEYMEHQNTIASRDAKRLGSNMRKKIS